MDVCAIGSAGGRGVVWLLGACCALVLCYTVMPTPSRARQGSRRRERHTLRTTPTTLTNIEATANSSTIRLPRLRINKPVLRLDNGCLAFIVYTQHLASDLELAAFAAHGQWLEELYLALAVEDVLGVELGDAFDGLGIAARVEVDDFLVRVLEGEDDGVGWEGCEGWVQFLRVVLEVLDSSGDCAWDVWFRRVRAVMELLT